MYWFEDHSISAQMPLPLKCYSAYCRRMLDRTKGTVKGGSFLLRELQKRRRWWRDEEPRAIRVRDLTVVLDPYSEVASFGLNEMLASSDEARVMRSALSRGDTFFDVGANHGAFALMASTMVGPEGSVVAFEPQPELADLLQASFEANGFAHASVREVALSDQEGSAEFFIPAHPGFAGVYEGFSGRGAHTQLRVRLVTLDGQIRKLRVPGRLFIKLDVEGSELPFLRGAETTIRQYRPVILMEINPESAAAAGYGIPELIAKLKELGYSRFAEMERYPETFSFDELGEERLHRFRDIVVVP